MNSFTQKLKREIAEKNILLNSFDQNYNSNSDKECAEDIKIQLDNLLYQYYKTLRYTNEES